MDIMLAKAHTHKKASSHEGMFWPLIWFSGQLPSLHGKEKPLFTKAINLLKYWQNKRWRNSKPFPVIFDVTTTPPWSPPLHLLSLLITHHCKGHELQDASTTSLLQAINALLHEALYELGVRSRHLGAKDGGNEEEKVGWGDENRWGLSSCQMF